MTRAARGDAARRRRGRRAPLAVPEPADPLLPVLGGQHYARALALATGLDPGDPRAIAKVTEAA